VSPNRLSWQAKMRINFGITAWEINQAFYFVGFFAMATKRCTLGCLENACMHIRTTCKTMLICKKNCKKIVRIPFFVVVSCRILVNLCMHILRTMSGRDQIDFDSLFSGKSSVSTASSVMHACALHRKKGI